jgi:hypothetical protein
VRKDENDMAAFMTAVQTGKGFKPALTSFDKNAYSFIKTDNVDKLFSRLHHAEKTFKASLQPQVNVESKRELQVAGFDR